MIDIEVSLLNGSVAITADELELKELISLLVEALSSKGDEREAHIGNKQYSVICFRRETTW